MFFYFESIENLNIAFNFVRPKKYGLVYSMFKKISNNKNFDRFLPKHIVCTFFIDV
jgi:hypothetical protein